MQLLLVTLRANTIKEFRRLRLDWRLDLLVKPREQLRLDTKLEVSANWDKQLQLVMEPDLTIKGNMQLLWAGEPWVQGIQIKDKTRLQLVMTLVGIDKLPARLRLDSKPD